MVSLPPAGTGVSWRTVAVALRATASSGGGGRCSALQKLSASISFSAGEIAWLAIGIFPSARLWPTVTAATFMSRSVMWASPWLAKMSPFQVIVVSPMVE
jgi:hypothetical protein